MCLATLQTSNRQIWRVSLIVWSFKTPFPGAGKVEKTTLALFCMSCEE